MHAAGHELPQRLRIAALTQALRSRDMALLHLDQNGTFDLAENLPREWPSGDYLNHTPSEVLAAPLNDLFAEALDQCQRFGAERVFEYELTPTEQPVTFEVRLSRDESGYLAVVSNVSVLRRQEAAMRLLMREVSHRTKNLLAIVQSVAVQTARHSSDIEQFLTKFRGRLYALSSTQDLVTDSDWSGTQFRDLLTSQMTRLGLDLHSKARISGANPLLGPNAALHIGLAMHELGANARVYGALAPATEGSVEIDARISDEPETAGSLIIDWHEQGSLQDPSEGTSGFGSLMLERIVPLSVGGSAAFTRSKDGVHYRLTVPADQLSS